MNIWNIIPLIIGGLCLFLPVLIYLTKGTIFPTFLFVLWTLMRPLAVISVLILTLRIGLALFSDFFKENALKNLQFQITRQEMLIDILIIILLLGILFFWYQYPSLFFKK